MFILKAGNSDNKELLFFSCKENDAFFLVDEENELVSYLKLFANVRLSKIKITIKIIISSLGF